MVTVMRTVVVIAFLIILVAGAPSLPAAQHNQASQTIATYCAGCHNGVMRSPSGALLEILHDLEPARWSSIIARVVRTSNDR